MTKTEYSEYLASDHWKATRQKQILWAGSKCQRCEVPRWLAEIAYDQDLHVHHRSYANLGSESITDLEVLCRRCHDIETFGRSDLRKVKQAICSLCGTRHFDPRSELCSMCSAIWLESEPSLDAWCKVENRHPHFVGAGLSQGWRMMLWLICRELRDDPNCFDEILNQLSDIETQHFNFWHRTDGTPCVQGESVA